jgi:hypothetical protein
MKTKLAAAAVGTALLITPAVALAGTSSNSPTTMKGSVSAQATVNRQIPLTPRPAVHRAHGSAQYQAQRASASSRSRSRNSRHLPATPSSSRSTAPTSAL